MTCAELIEPTCVFCDGKFDAVKIYENDICVSFLENEQSVLGYTLVFMKPHYDTLFARIRPYDLLTFWCSVQDIGKALKKTLDAENVYACTLCDGISHFHVHLIPRYAWTDGDKARYRELFTERDGEKSVEFCTSNNLIGGFWYLADAERNFNKTMFMQLPPEERQEKLLKLAERINAWILRD